MKQLNELNLGLVQFKFLKEGNNFWGRGGPNISKAKVEKEKEKKMCHSENDALLYSMNWKILLEVYDWLRWKARRFKKRKN